MRDEKSEEGVCVSFYLQLEAVYHQESSPHLPLLFSLSRIENPQTILVASNYLRSNDLLRVEIYFGSDCLLEFDRDGEQMVPPVVHLNFSLITS